MTAIRALTLLRSLFAALALAFAPAALADPLEIRFTAATLAHSNDSLAASPFDSSTHQAGYDIIWRGDIFGQAYVRDGPPVVLFAGGEAHARYADGSGDCDSTFQRNSNITFFPEVTVSNGTVKVAIALPQIAGNTGTTAFLMDPLEGPFECRVPRSAFISGNLVERTCPFSPIFFAPGDDDIDTRCVNHGTKAYFELSAATRSYTSPFSYTFTGRGLNDMGGVDSFRKTVWFGKVTVRPSKSSSPPPATDPFTLFGYDVPSAPTGLPSDAPTDNRTPNDGPIEADPWLRELLDRLKKIIRILRGEPPELPPQGFFTAPLVSQTGDNPPFSFDSTTGILTVPTNGLITVPGTGSAKLHLVLRKPDKAKGFKPKIAKSALSNQVSTGESPSLALLLDRKAIAALDSRKKQVAFVVADFVPEGRGKRSQRSAKFTLKATKR